MRRRALKAKNKHWSESQRLEAVTTYLAIGNVTATAAALSIPLPTLKRWRQEDWWKTYEEELKHEESLQVSNRLKKIINRALDVTEDRLDNGNFQLNQKTGELVRIPVNAKDASKIANDMLDRKVKVEDIPAQQQIEKTIDDRLAKLASEFARFSSAKEVRSTPITVTVEDNNDAA